MNALRTIPKEKLKLGIWIIAIVIVGLVVGQLFKGINADQLASTSTSPGAPQWEKGAAITGFATLDIKTAEYKFNGRVVNFDCEGGAIGATIARYIDDTSAPSVTSTDQNCDYWWPNEPGNGTFCAFKSGDEVPQKPSDIRFEDQKYCEYTEMAAGQDTFLDLQVIATKPAPKYGILRVYAKTPEGGPAVSAKVNVDCPTKPEFHTGETNTDGLFERIIRNPEQNCNVEVFGFPGTEKHGPRPVYINVFPPTSKYSDITFTDVKMTPSTSTPKPLTQHIIHSVFGIRKASAQVNAPKPSPRKQVVRTFTKKPAAPSQKLQSNAKIAGQLVESTESGSLVAIPNVPIKISHLGPGELNTTSGFYAPGTWFEETRTDSNGVFAVQNVEFLENPPTDNPNKYKIEILDANYHGEPKVTVDNKPNSNNIFQLVKNSTWNGIPVDTRVKNAKTAAQKKEAYTYFYKQNKIQVVATPKVKYGLEAHTKVLDSTNPELGLGQFTINAPKEESPLKVSEYTYTQPKESEYTVLFAATDRTKVEFVKFVDEEGNELPLTLGTKDSAVKGTKIQLTPTKKNRRVEVQLNAVIKPELSGKSVGTVTTIPAPQLKVHFKVNDKVVETGTQFTYEEAEFDKEYKLSAETTSDAVAIEGIYNEVTGQKITAPITLTKDKPSLKILVKVEPASTKLLGAVTPTTEKTISQNFDKKSLKDQSDGKLKKVLEGLLNWLLETIDKFLPGDLVKSSVRATLLYRIPHEGITIVADNTKIGVTDDKGKTPKISGNRWVGQTAPKIQAIDGKIPGCIEITAETKIVKKFITKGYAHVKGKLDPNNPVIGDLKPNATMTAGQDNVGEVATSTFKVENILIEGDPIPYKGDGSNFFSDPEKLKRCFEGKPIEAPKFITAFVNPSKKVELEEGKTFPATVFWHITEADGTEITDPSITATIQIKEGDRLYPEETIKMHGDPEEKQEPGQPIKYKPGTKDITLRLDGKKGIDYDIILRIKGTQRNEPKNLNASTTHKKKK